MHMKHLKYIGSIILLALTLGCEEQKVDIEKFGNLSGLVVDGETYEPINGVLITTNPASSSDLTNTEGIFSFTKVQEGDIAVTAHKNDYLSNSINIAVYDEQTTEITFFLLKDNKNIGWVDIYDPVPGNGATDQNISFTMQWKVDQQYPSKELTYTVYFFESNSTTQKIAGENLTDEEVIIDNLEYSKTYYWYVLAKYEGDHAANSPTWTFKTRTDTTKR